MIWGEGCRGKDGRWLKVKYIQERLDIDKMKVVTFLQTAEQNIPPLSEATCFPPGTFWRIGNFLFSDNIFHPFRETQSQSICEKVCFF